MGSWMEPLELLYFVLVHNATVACAVMKKSSGVSCSHVMDQPLDTPPKDDRYLLISGHGLLRVLKQKKKKKKSWN